MQMHDLKALLATACQRARRWRT